jgi:hypothetical protein
VPPVRSFGWKTCFCLFVLPLFLMPLATPTLDSCEVIKAFVLTRYKSHAFALLRQSCLSWKHYVHIILFLLSSKIGLWS